MLSGGQTSRYTSDKQHALFILCLQGKVPHGLVQLVKFDEQIVVLRKSYFLDSSHV